MEQNMEITIMAKYPSSTFFPFAFWGLLIKAEQKEKGYPYCEWVTGEPGWAYVELRV